MNTEEIAMVLEEGLDVESLLQRAIARRNEQLRLETERLRVEREAKRNAALEEANLAYLVYVGAVKDGLKAAVERAKETRFAPNEAEKAMVAGEIPFEIKLIRSTSWRYFPDFWTHEVGKARHNLSRARAKLQKF
jgi:hypothetical protein